MVRMKNKEESRNNPNKIREQKKLQDQEKMVNLEALNSGLSAFMNGGSADAAGSGNSAAAGSSEEAGSSHSAAVDHEAETAGHHSEAAGRHTAPSALVLNQTTDGSRSGKKSGPPKRRGGILRVFLVLFLVLAIVAAAGAGTLYFLRERGKKALLAHKAVEGVEITAPDSAVVADGGRTVTYNGKTYERDDDVISILCMGVDRSEAREAMADKLRIGEQGQADTLFVACINVSNGKITMINISRDSMVAVDKYNVDGEYVGVEDLQICTAFAYGNGKDTSCQNVSKSVSRLLYGIPMDAYGSIDIPAIGVLNDAVGGVPVTILEDMTDIDPAMTKGATITLTGEQARKYVRTREHVNADANNARMQRQRHYVTSFIRKVLEAARSNLSVVFSLYQAASSYMTTNLDASEVIYLTSLVMTRDFTSQNIVTVPGEAVMGEQYAEYYVDQDALYEIILDVYYNEVGEDGQVIKDDAPQENTNLLPETEEPKEERIITVDHSVLN